MADVAHERGKPRFHVESSSVWCRGCVYSGDSPENGEGPAWEAVGWRLANESTAGIGQPRYESGGCTLVDHVDLPTVSWVFSRLMDVQSFFSLVATGTSAVTAPLPILERFHGHVPPQEHRTLRLTGAVLGIVCIRCPSWSK